MSKTAKKNPTFITYPKTTIVLATLLLGSLYTIVTADKTSKQIQVVCAIIAAIAVMVIISSFVAIFCNRNNKKDVQENTVDASSIANVSTQTSFAERGTQTDYTKKSVVERGTQTDDTQTSVVERGTQIETENMQENVQAQTTPQTNNQNNGDKPNAQVATAKSASMAPPPLLVNNSMPPPPPPLLVNNGMPPPPPPLLVNNGMPPPPPPEPKQEQLNNGYKSNVQQDVKPAPKVADVQQQDFTNELKERFKHFKKDGTIPPQTKPQTGKKNNGDNKHAVGAQNPMYKALQQRRVNISDSQSSTLKSMHDSTYDLNSNMVPTTPPAVKSMAPPTPPQEPQVLPHMPPLPPPPFLINGIISTPLPTKPTKAQPQASNQNNGDNRNDLFKQIREGVKLKPADAKQDVNQVAAVAQQTEEPSTGNAVADALRYQVGTIMTKSFIAAAQKKKSMTESQATFDWS